MVIILKGKPYLGVAPYLVVTPYLGRPYLGVTLPRGSPTGGSHTYGGCPYLKGNPTSWELLPRGSLT